MIKIINYAGNKLRYMDLINPEIDRLPNNVTRYVEPFTGSSNVFLNVNRTFSNYQINDLNPHLCNIYNQVGINRFDKFREFYNRVIEKYGSIKNKESYYRFRGDYNTRLHGKGSSNEAFALIMLINACINNFCRFGPNGFNQACGIRDYSSTIVKDGGIMWTEASSKFMSAHITNTTYRDIIEQYHDNKDTLLFLDPPYFKRPSHSYDKEFDENEFNTFISMIRNAKCKIAYTDVQHDMLPDWNVKQLREIINSAPSSTGTNKVTGIEVLYTNY